MITAYITGKALSFVGRVAVNKAKKEVVKEATNQATKRAKDAILGPENKAELIDVNAIGRFRRRDVFATQAKVGEFFGLGAHYKRNTASAALAMLNDSMALSNALAADDASDEVKVIKQNLDVYLEQVKDSFESLEKADLTTYNEVEASRKMHDTFDELTKSIAGLLSNEQYSGMLVGFLNFSPNSSSKSSVANASNIDMYARELLLIMADMVRVQSEGFRKGYLNYLMNGLVEQPSQQELAAEDEKQLNQIKATKFAKTLTFFDSFNSIFLRDYLVQAGIHKHDVMDRKFGFRRFIPDTAKDALSKIIFPSHNSYKELLFDNILEQYESFIGKETSPRDKSKPIDARLKALYNELKAKEANAKACKNTQLQDFFKLLLNNLSGFQTSLDASNFQETNNFKKKITHKLSNRLQERNQDSRQLATQISQYSKGHAVLSSANESATRQHVSDPIKLHRETSIALYRHKAMEELNTLVAIHNGGKNVTKKYQELKAKIDEKSLILNDINQKQTDLFKLLEANEQVLATNTFIRSLLNDWLSLISTISAQDYLKFKDVLIKRFIETSYSNISDEKGQQLVAEIIKSFSDVVASLFNFSGEINPLAKLNLNSQANLNNLSFCHVIKDLVNKNIKTMQDDIDTSKNELARLYSAAQNVKGCYFGFINDLQDFVELLFQFPKDQEAKQLQDIFKDDDLFAQFVIDMLDQIRKGEYTDHASLMISCVQDKIQFTAEQLTPLKSLINMVFNWVLKQKDPKFTKMGQLLSGNLYKLLKESTTQLSSFIAESKNTETILEESERKIVAMLEKIQQTGVECDKATQFNGEFMQRFEGFVRLTLDKSQELALQLIEGSATHIQLNHKPLHVVLGKLIQSPGVSPQLLNKYIDLFNCYQSDPVKFKDLISIFAQFSNFNAEKLENNFATLSAAIAKFSITQQSLEEAQAACLKLPDLLNKGELSLEDKNILINESHYMTEINFLHLISIGR